MDPQPHDVVAERCVEQGECGEENGLGQGEWQDLVDGAPKTVKEGVNKADADSIKKKLVEAGAKVDVK